GEDKNKAGREFPFTAELRKILKAQRKRANKVQREKSVVVPSVFFRDDGSAIRSYRKGWKDAVDASGVQRIPHDFRRTAVRNLEIAGVPRSVAMKMVGHRTESIYRRYAIVDEAMLKEGSAKLALLHAGQSLGPSAPAQATAVVSVSRKLAKLAEGGGFEPPR